MPLNNRQVNMIVNTTNKFTKNYIKKIKSQISKISEGHQ